MLKLPCERECNVESDNVFYVLDNSDGFAS